MGEYHLIEAIGSCKMDWASLLNLGRLGDPSYAEEPHRPIYVQDSDRIVFSQPFRRLANKTQVHPLYENDHLHHRLIHSIETASVGRSLGMSVGHWLETQKHIEAGQKHAISGLVYAACLAHDIGNPPFGHSGEAAMGEWFEERLDGAKGIFGAVEASHRAEFEQFEGNAQGFRILTRLEMYRNQGGMRLSNGVLATFAKYPVTAYVKSSVRESYCGLKKFGVFEAEREIFEEVALATGLRAESSPVGVSWWRRHPLVFLVEAADDICYSILDLEDGFTAGDLSFEAVRSHLEPVSGVPNHQREDKTEIEWISYLRARSIGASIHSCVEAFIENYDSIMDGTFSNSLIDTCSKNKEFYGIKKVSRERIFTARRKTELEVSGRNTIRQVLDGVLPVLDELKTKNWDESKLSDYNGKLSRAINLDFRDAKDSYHALHVLCDFVSGMTDRYTLKVARMISGN
ncbi:dGTP triphosphohydrolase [Pseudogemmobacter blasticus]|nr:dNTP triphosphohydrolase [Fuscovulum blasticum]